MQQHFADAEEGVVGIWNRNETTIDLIYTRALLEGARVYDFTGKVRVTRPPDPSLPPFFLRVYRTHVCACSFTQLRILMIVQASQRNHLCICYAHYVNVYSIYCSLCILWSALYLVLYKLYTHTHTYMYIYTYTIWTNLTRTG